MFFEIAYIAVCIAFSNLAFNSDGADGFLTAG
jgi:hypothetical protein